MEVGNARDHFRLAEGDPALFVQIAAAWAVAVAAGACMHLDTAAGIAAGQRVSQLPCLAGEQGIHHFELFLGDRV